MPDRADPDFDFDAGRIAGRAARPGASRKDARDAFRSLRDTEGMGSESVELVRRVYFAWQAGDLEELLALVDPEVSWSPVLRFAEGETAAVGHQGLRRWFRRIRITYRSLRPVPQSFEDHGSQVLVLRRLVGASRLTR